MRVPSQDLYFIETITSAITGTPTWSATKGLDTSIYNLLPTNKPDLLSNKVVSDVRKATGLSQRRTGAGYEFTMLGEEPGCNGMTVEMDRKNLGLFLWLLFQSGCSEGTTPYFKKTAIPYTDHECEVWCSIGRLLDASTESHRIDGCIISSLTISGTAQQVVTMSVDFMGRDYDNSVDLSAVATTAVGQTPVLFSGIATTLGGVAIELQSFEITIANNAIRRPYDNALCSKIILGDLSVTGNISIPWTQTNESKNTPIDDFLAGEDNLLVLTIGTGSQDEIVIKSNIRYEQPTLQPDEVEHMNALPFLGVYDGTNHAIEITCEDSVSRGIS